ncbi:Minor fimbrium tip subunit Mfa3 [Porphyromonas levii]|nr:Minor fimbrium tip subunit Mfa3 [Porphyromonas levii]MBR8759721.1 Minor fimbrium tip subunit Mfa3 [Porphyromonas levii]
MSNKYHTVALLVTLLMTVLSVGCKREESPSSSPDKYTTYLRFVMSGIKMPGDSNTRAQGDELSVNSDHTDLEDYVARLAVLVYDATTGQLVKASFVYNSDFVLGIPLAQGETKKFHFCFIANFPVSWGNTLLGIKTYEGLKKTLQEIEPFRSRDRGLELYDGAGKDYYFPMSRIYENNSVWAAQATTRENPQTFLPKSEGNGSLKPISSYPTKKESGEEQATVNLIRTAAKVSIRIIEGADGVERVVMQNIKPVHSYMESDSPSNFPEDQLIRREFKVADEGGTYKAQMYIPENILGVYAQSLSWDIGNMKPYNGSICYITIVMKDGSSHNFPIITNELGGYDYFEMVRGQVDGKLPNFNIIRNHEYQFDIIVPALTTDLDIKVHYVVKPWDVQKIEIPFE